MHYDTGFSILHADRFRPADQCVRQVHGMGAGVTDYYTSVQSLSIANKYKKYIVCAVWCTKQGISARGYDKMIADNI